MVNKEAMKLALEAIEAAIKSGDWKVDGACDPDMAITALREALAEQPAHHTKQHLEMVAEQPAQQEPIECANGCRGFVKHSPPAQRKEDK